MQKDAQKGDFWNSLDPFWGFILKTVPGIHDPRISGLPFGTKNHEMRGPPVHLENWVIYLVGVTKQEYIKQKGHP